MLGLFRSLFLMLVFANFFVEANTGEYLVYSDSAGNIYLEAPKQFILIHSDVSIPLLITPKNGLLKLTLSENIWSAAALTLSQWQSANLTYGSNSVKTINYFDYDSDGYFDVEIIFTNGQPSIIVSGITSAVKISTSSRVVTYLHTDVLGSVIAESDSNKKIIKNTDYKPFGERKNEN